MQQPIRGQEPMTACNRPPCGILLRWPAWVVGGNDLNLMLRVPPVAPEPVPVRKLSEPPLVVTPGRRAIEPVQVHRVQRDGLLTTELPLHAINMVEPHVHEKNDGNHREPCLHLARLGDPVRLYGAPVRCHVRGPQELQKYTAQNCIQKSLIGSKQQIHF
ncbi:hypothetical protein PIB30_069020 [Stylosanthes scabra]|uniref:Uncharacterized protein n=1 Tax=Stylosanthes scabra TaxID=79078 RepID=A0ABU6ZLS2_9FABA|nr:hypothetical protein [Stylosanthes scabra]